MSDESEPQPTQRNTYDRLAARILCESVVPFLGAGFSYGTEDRKGFRNLPKTMPEALTRRLEKVLDAAPPDGQAPGETIRQAFETAKSDFDKKPGSLGELAELAHLLLGPRDLCETLQIHRYADLRPLASHRCLIYLVREGLIGEIITTNYDTCLETAFRESHADPAEAEARLAVVTSLEEYRAEAGGHARPGHLILYKINGCAREYATRRNTCEQGQAEEAARKIILTERQLQTFRQEQWAQELLRDRARTRNLLFSGFGSAEPQIRHTVLTLMEEFAGGERVRRPDETMDLPNAPFIQVHGPALSFYQTQILVGFLDAHSHPARMPGRPETRIEPVFANVFCAPRKEAALDASDFMLNLFSAVYRGLVRWVTGPGQDLALWLRNQTPSWRAWLPEPGRLLDTPANNTHATDVDGPDKRPLLTPSEPGCFPLPLWRVLYGMRFPNRPLPTDFYLSLRDEPVLILLTMTFLARLGLPGSWAPPFDLTVPSASVQNGATAPSRRRAMHVRLIEDAAVPALFDQPRTPPDGSRLIRLIAIPSRRPGLVEGPWRTVGASERTPVRSLRVGRFVVVAAADLVRAAHSPERLPAVVAACFAESLSQPAARLTRIHPRRDTP